MSATGSFLASGDMEMWARHPGSFQTYSGASTSSVMARGGSGKPLPGTARGTTPRTDGCGTARCGWPRARPRSPRLGSRGAPGPFPLLSSERSGRSYNSVSWSNPAGHDLETGAYHKDQDEPACRKWSRNLALWLRDCVVLPCNPSVDGPGAARAALSAAAAAALVDSSSQFQPGVAFPPRGPGSGERSASFSLAKSSSSTSVRTSQFSIAS